MRTLDGRKERIKALSASLCNPPEGDGRRRDDSRMNIKFGKIYEFTFSSMALSVHPSVSRASVSSKFCFFSYQIYVCGVFGCPCPANPCRPAQNIQKRPGKTVKNRTNSQGTPIFWKKSGKKSETVNREELTAVYHATLHSNHCIILHFTAELFQHFTRRFQHFYNVRCQSLESEDVYSERLETASRSKPNLGPL